tara:strand:- start:113 stop:526 length:414 start_codon:yes stop_codon:yes gene_type:complete
MDFTRINEQISKHKRLINENEINEAEYEMAKELFELGGHKDTKEYKQLTQRARFRKLHIKHSKYMIRIFESFRDLINLDPYQFARTLRVVIGLIKANTQDIEDCMRQLVDIGYYKEQEYKQHMEGFMNEINAWEMFN